MPLDFFRHKLKDVNNNQSQLKSKLAKAIDTFALPLALYGSLATAPQVYQVVILKQTAGISIATFGLFLLGNLFWGSYGFLHKDKPILLSHLTTGFLNLLIVGGVLFIK